MVPVMSTGGTDGIYLETIGIPSYGPPAHGLNEHARVDAVYKGRDFLFDLIKEYAGGS